VDTLGVSGCGLRRESSPELPPNDLTSVNEVIAGLGTYVKYVAYYVPYCSSTQDLAKSLAEGNAPEGVIVIADEMSGGRGRLGRYWHAPKGGLWFTLVLRPKFTKALQLLNLATGVALIKALTEFNINARLKWPNDVVVCGRKLAGILIEAPATSGKVKYVLVGVGVNVNNEVPNEVRDVAVSIKDLINREVPRALLLKYFLSSFDKLYHELAGGNVNHIINEWRRYSDTLGRYVKVYLTNGVIEGRAVDVNDDGHLILLTNDGVEVVINSGDVIHLR